MKNLEFYIKALGQKEKELQEAYQNNAYKFQIERIEDIEDFFEDEDDDKYEYTYDLLEAIYEYIIYETDKNRINKNIDDVMQRMQNNGERIEQEVE